MILFAIQDTVSTVTALPTSFHLDEGFATSSADLVQSAGKPCNLSASLISGHPISPLGNAIAGADRALVVTTPEVSAIRDADRIIGLLDANEIKKVDLIVNRLRMDMVKKGDMMSIEDVVDILAIDLIGAVPDDENIVIATNQGEPLVGNSSLAGQAYMNICRRIVGEEVPMLDLAGGTGFFSKIAGLFKKN